MPFEAIGDHLDLGPDFQQARAQLLAHRLLRRRRSGR
jgi:hypothetical protein